MFNVGGITKQDLVNTKQILANTVYVGISVMVDEGALPDEGLTILAGTPLNLSFLDRIAYAPETNESDVSNANCVLLHDITFGEEDETQNGTVVIKGTINMDRLDEDVAELYDEHVLAALQVNGINVINNGVPTGESPLIEPGVGLGFEPITIPGSSPAVQGEQNG